MNQRPLGVTLVAIIAWISGFLQIVGSIFVIIAGLFITCLLYTSPSPRDS